MTFISLYSNNFYSQIMANKENAISDILYYFHTNVGIYQCLRRLLFSYSVYCKITLCLKDLHVCHDKPIYLS